MAPGVMRGSGSSFEIARAGTSATAAIATSFNERRTFRLGSKKHEMTVERMLVCQAA